MTDLIDRQAVIETLLKGKIDEDESLVECPEECNAMIDGAIEDIKALPSVLPEKCEDCGNFNKARLLIPQPERKTGRWIKMSDADGVYWACSECGEDIPRVSDFDPQFDLFPRLKSLKKTNFCPNCGAEME